MASSNDGKVIRRRGRTKRNSDASTQHSVTNNTLTLVDQVLITALTVDGSTDFWNDQLSGTLRGCIMIELNLRDRIVLESKTGRRRSLRSRNVIVRDATLTGERILDETLKHIIDASRNQLVPVSTWLQYLSGDNWNPWYWRYQLKEVKERVAKDLVEKGFLNFQTFSYILFDTARYPLKDCKTKLSIVEDIQNGLLTNWRGKPHRMDIRQLALVLCCHGADIFEEALSQLDNATSELAKIRLNSVLECDFENESQMSPQGHDLTWAVFEAMLK